MPRDSLYSRYYYFKNKHFGAVSAKNNSKDMQYKHKSAICLAMQAGWVSGLRGAGSGRSNQIQLIKNTNVSEEIEMCVYANLSRSHGGQKPIMECLTLCLAFVFGSKYIQFEVQLGTRNKSKTGHRRWALRTEGYLYNFSFFIYFLGLRTVASVLNNDY